MSSEQFEGFLVDADDNGHLDKDKFTGNKAKLISCLGEFEDALKQQVFDSIGKPGSAFDWAGGQTLETPATNEENSILAKKYSFYALTLFLHFANFFCFSGLLRTFFL